MKTKRLVACIVAIALCVSIGTTLAVAQPETSEVMPVNAAPEIKLTVVNQSMNRVDDRLFGHFLEKATGEQGPENSLVEGTKETLPAVKQKLLDMHIPVIRFPGGYTVDYTDWRDLIDNVPNMHDKRPDVTVQSGDKKTLGTKYGYDEYLTLAEDIDVESILALNLREAVAKERPLEESAMLAAGLVAYCNAPVGAKLPEGMPNWPSVRAKNGHEEPWDVRYFQLGNEPWIWPEITWALNGNAKSPIPGVNTMEELQVWYTTCLKVYAEKIKEVDPDVEIIISGWMRKVNTYTLNDQELVDNTDYLDFHLLKPWSIPEIKKENEKYPPQNVSEEEIWNAYITTPNINADGKSYILPNDVAGDSYPLQSSWKAYLGEWTWIGGWYNGDEYDQLPFKTSETASALGAAGYLHGLIREGDRISIATQSILMKNPGPGGWNFANIYYSTSPGEDAFIKTTGQVTAMYSKYHGNRRLDLMEENIPTYEQPYTFGKIEPSPKVVKLDSLVTESDDKLYIHSINRDISEDFTVTIDVSAVPTATGGAVLHYVSGRVLDEATGDEPPITGGSYDIPVGKVENGKLTVTLPARSVSVVEIWKDGKMPTLSEQIDKFMLDFSSDWSDREIKAMRYYQLAPEPFFLQLKTTVRREQLAAMVSAMLAAYGKASPAAPDDTFTDIGESKYKEAILIATGTGILKGNGDGTFLPHQNLSRQELSVTLAALGEYLGLEKPEAGQIEDMYADHEQIAAWAQNSVVYCTLLGLAKGVEDGVFDPTGALTMEQAMVFMHRIGVEGNLIQY